MSENYTVQNYVDDLQATVAAAESESEILSKVRPLAQKLVENRDTWIKPEHYEVNDDRGSSLYVLHEEADHTLMVFAACFRPGRVTPVHDHGTWAVVAGVDGEEKNTIYLRTDDGSKPGYGEIQFRGDKVVRHGDAIGMPAGTFHTVSNESNEVSVSLHTYGMNTNHTVRCQIDPETGKVDEFKIPLREG
tara:strand:+ start:119 stop:688 length:570 start_codon:yes stop_codon:yes gene_type:complete